MNLPNVLNAVTVTTTSNVVNIANNRGVTLLFTAASISSGNGVFTVDGLVGGRWITGIPIIDGNVSNTNAQNLTRVTSATLSTNASKVYHLDPHQGFEAIRIKVTVTTDGSYSADVSGQKIAVK